MSISTLGDKERKETGKCFQRLNCDATVLSIRFLFILYIYWTLKVFSIEEEEAIEIHKKRIFQKKLMLKVGMTYENAINF